MTKTHFSLILLAVLTALMLTGCGQETSSVESSETIGMETWGDTIDPAATPSMGQVIQATVAPDDTSAPTQAGAPTTIEGQDDETVSPEPTTTDTPSPSPSATAKPSGGSSSTPAVSPSNSPSIAPPAPASSATIDDVQAYVGKTLNELIENLGYPLSSDYQLVDESDPDKGEKGTLYFSDFIATTRRDDSGEIVTSATPTTSSQSVDDPTEE